MDIKEAVSLFRYYQQSTRRKRTRESYRVLLQPFGVRRMKVLEHIKQGLWITGYISTARVPGTWVHILDFT